MAPFIHPAQHRSPILVILVLYNCPLSESPAYLTFCEAALRCGLDPGILAIYDNSPLCGVRRNEQIGIHAFHHDSSNRGLAAAYNWALSLAAKKGAEWLLLLDQDSELPADFLREMLDAAACYASEPEVAAVVPHVLGHAGPVSPTLVHLGRLSSVREGLCGIVRRELTAVNSGTLVRASFVRSIGGFNPDFPLDWLDHWLFHEIYAGGKTVAVLPATLRHELSVQDYRKQITPARLRSILTSEARFVTRYKGGVERLLHLIRLLARAVKHALVYRNIQSAGCVLSTIPLLFFGADGSRRYIAA